MIPLKINLLFSEISSYISGFLKKTFNSKDIVISHLNKANYINILSSMFLTNHKTIVVIHNHPNHYIHSYSFIKSYYKFIVHYLIQVILYRFADESSNNIK